MVEVVRPAVGERIYDPCFGTAGFLAEAGEYIRRTAGALSGAALEKLKRESFFGIELKPLTYLLGLMNMLLHRIEGANLELGNALERHAQHVPERSRYDVILSNPSYGGKLAGERQTHFTIRSGATEILFQHIMANLAMGGRAAVIIPEGVLFLGGPVAKVRERLLQDFDVHTILSLPAGYFLPYTGVKTSVLFFDRREDGRGTESIWYYELANDGFELNQTRRPVEGSQIPDFLAKWEGRGCGVNSWIVPVEEVAGKGFDFWARNSIARDLRTILDTDQSRGESADVSPDLMLGLLAGLLIAKWAAHDESEREALAACEERAFTPGLSDGLRLSAWDAPSPNHADAVAEAFGGMITGNGAEGAAARYVTHVAPLVTRAAESSREMYERLLGWVRRLDLGTPRGRTLAAHLFDDVLRMTLDKQGKQIGEFVTPEPVAALMLSLANPKSGDKIYDPCFGFGELLVGAARQLGEAAWVASPHHRADVQVAEVFGVEINRVAHAVGLCRALLSGVDRPGVELGDALERPLPRNRSTDGFDCILAAPPWGGRNQHPSAARFPFPSRNTESLFLQHVMANLRSGGRAVVVLPESALFRTGDRRLRKTLLSDYSVDAVVSLPDGVFSPWTGVAMSLVVFRRAKGCRSRIDTKKTS